MLAHPEKDIRNDSEAVAFPQARMRLYSDMVSAREPTATNVIEFMDGLGLTAECTDERLTQNASYCGDDCDTMVNNVFVFGPDGKEFFCAINYPSSWADGTLTSHFFNHIQKRIGDFKLCVDQVFPRSGDAHGIFCRADTQKERSLIALFCS